MMRFPHALQLTCEAQNVLRTLRVLAPFVTERTPMSLSESDVRHVALLARLELSDAEIERFRTDLNSILGHIDEIQRLDLEGVEPTAHPLDVVNVTRPDEVRPGLTQAEALLNAPEAEEGAFVIPQIVGPGGAE